MTPLSAGMSDAFSSGSPTSTPQQALNGYAMKGAAHPEQAQYMTGATAMTPYPSPAMPAGARQMTMQTGESQMQSQQQHYFLPSNAQQYMLQRNFPQDAMQQAQIKREVRPSTENDQIVGQQTLSYEELSAEVVHLRQLVAHRDWQQAQHLNAQQQREANSNQEPSHSSVASPDANSCSDNGHKITSPYFAASSSHQNADILSDSDFGNIDVYNLDADKPGPKHAG